MRRQVLAPEAPFGRPFPKYLDHLQQLLRAALHHFVQILNPPVMPRLHVVQQAHAGQDIDKAGVLVIGQRRLR